MNQQRVWICLNDIHYVEVVLDRSPTQFLYRVCNSWGQNREVQCWLFSSMFRNLAFNFAEGAEFHKTASCFNSDETHGSIGVRLHLL